MTRPARDEITVTGTSSVKPPRNKFAARAKTAKITTMVAKPISGRRRWRVIERLRADTRGARNCAPPFGMTSPSHPQRAFDDGAGRYAGTYLWVNDSVVNIATASCSVGLLAPFDDDLLFAVQGSHT